MRFRWSSAWKGLLRARLDSAYHSDVVFKFLHRVLPTPHRLLLFLLSHDPGCPCGHRRATIDHIFGRCPTARLLRLPLRRLLSVFLPSVPSNLTLVCTFSPQSRFFSCSLLSRVAVYCYILAALSCVIPDHHS